MPAWRQRERETAKARYRADRQLQLADPVGSARVISKEPPLVAPGLRPEVIALLAPPPPVPAPPGTKRTRDGTLVSAGCGWKFPPLIHDLDRDDDDAKDASCIECKIDDEPDVIAQLAVDLGASIEEIEALDDETLLDPLNAL